MGKDTLTVTSDSRESIGDAPKDVAPKKSFSPPTNASGFWHGISYAAQCARVAQSLPDLRNYLAALEGDTRKLVESIDQAEASVAARVRGGPPASIGGGPGVVP